MALTKKMLSFQLRLKMGFVRVSVGRCERIRELRQMTARRGRGGKGRRHMKARERERSDVRDSNRDQCGSQSKPLNLTGSKISPEKF